MKRGYNAVCWTASEGLLLLTHRSRTTTKTSSSSAPPSPTIFISENVSPHCGVPCLVDISSRRSLAGIGTGRMGKRQPQSREVSISKSLSFVLRHGAEKVGIPFDEGGWANVQDVVSIFHFSALYLLGNDAL